LPSQEYLFLAKKGIGMMEAAEGGGASDWIMLSFASPKKG
jgi:hypothetical protein